MPGSYTVRSVAELLTCTDPGAIYNLPISYGTGHGEQ